MLRIWCKETGEEFTMRGLCKHLHCATKTIRKELDNGRWCRDGKTYILIDEFGNNLEKYPTQIAKRVLDTKTGKVYQSVLATSRDVGLSSTWIMCKVGKAERFRYLTDDECKAYGLARLSSDKFIGIIDVVSGERWNSLLMCADALGVSVTTIYNRIKEKEPLNGHYLEYQRVYDKEYTDEEKAYLKGFER